MFTVLILHGVSGYAGIHWQKWLHDELTSKGYKVIMPTLPSPDAPNREEWLGAVIESINKINLNNLIIVGHSLGVATALDFIEQAPTSIKGLISVSGFGEDYGSELNTEFMKARDIDYSKVRKNLLNSYVVYGNDDPYVPQEVLKHLAGKIGANVEVIPKGGHLNTEAGYTKFPLLLEKILELSKK